MQKAIAKYGLAAHLALLAVAPLVLFPYCGGATIATVVLWLSLSAACWTLLEPSVRKGEMLHDARRRVSLAIVRDPLFWTLLAVAVLVGLRALNTGISIFYDYETRGWTVSPPFLEFLPGAMSDSGYLPFAAAVATTVLVVACRHALGRSARMAFLLVGSLAAGLSSSAALYFACHGNAVAKAAMECGMGWSFRPGVAFAFYLLCSTVAAFGAFERKWSRAVPAVMLAIAGNAAGLFAFSTPFEIVVFFGADLVLFLFVFICAWRKLHGTTDFKLLVVFAVSVMFGGLLVAAAMPDELLSARLDAIIERKFFLPEFMDLRRVLSAVAFKVWAAHPWAGAGIGAFQFNMRFNLAAADWALVPRGIAAVPNGWWQLVAERGIVGAVLIALPVGFLAFTYLKRLVVGVRARELPGPSVLLAPLALAALLAVTFFGCSLLRADVLMAMGAIFAVSAMSFPKKGMGK